MRTIIFKFYEKNTNENAIIFLWLNNTPQNVKKNKPLVACLPHSIQSSSSSSSSST
jgi:hypothetical protein